VSVLYCEGAENSPDVRLLGLLLGDVVGEIVPWGGKDGLPAMVNRGRRKGLPVCALIDGDFPRDPDAWAHSDEACVWEHGGNGPSKVLLGWRWRRKEVENYLLDPVVLAGAFGWSADQTNDYRAVLEHVFDDIAVHTAARMALTVCAPPRNRLNTEINLGDDLSTVRATLEARALEHDQKAKLDVDKLLRWFDALIPGCQNGPFRQHPMSAFAGKNILARLQNAPGVQKIDRNLKDHKKLTAAVFGALESEGSAVIDWLPEWRSLHDAVAAWSPPTA
jgi:hypothetical protein